MACRSWTWTLSSRDVEAELVGLAERDARLDAAAGQPHREGVGVMVAAVVAALHHRRAAEFAAPDDERVVEQPALLQIRDQRGAGLVGVLAVLLEILDEVAVLVPRLVEELHEADAALDQPAGEQAVVGEGWLAGLGAVHVQRCASVRLERSISSGALDCMRYAISYELMRVAISGSPMSSRRIWFSCLMASSVSRWSSSSTPAGWTGTGPGRRCCGTARPVDRGQEAAAPVASCRRWALSAPELKTTKPGQSFDSLPRP